MIFNCILFVIGILLSFVGIFAYDTYVENLNLKLEIEKLKNKRKDNLNE